MKYLKLFEEFKPVKYNPGDYCLIKLDIRGKREFEAKLLEIDNLGYNFEFLINASDTLNSINNDDKIITYHNPIIIRKLTPEEIQEFDLKYNSIKYNL